eukprot:CAMPEP_0172748308 /NCGR_PEP_ID=MMETSP1074-20121228/144771_1 /TAXON_ID=2916 /ORGANISM="Ceratium fusus, Strain PA161109" /LENGTH=88 /DNA_ID=CAMNT_0013580023 /DNA_START=44 /DNA_END=306 /DNA_ORIENTATION=+
MSIPDPFFASAGAVPSAEASAFINDFVERRSLTLPKPPWRSTAGTLYPVKLRGATMFPCAAKVQEGIRRVAHIAKITTKSMESGELRT